MTFDRELGRLREAVRRLQYKMTIHAEEDGLTVLEVESAVLTGHVVQRQKDRETGQWKYGIRSETIGGATIDVVARFSFNEVVIITIYRT